jgi:hypothetical protein
MAICDVLHTATWQSLHRWRAAAVTAGNLQQPRLWAPKAVQPHIAAMARRSQRMRRAIAAMAGTAPRQTVAQRAEEANRLRIHAEEAYRLRMAATKKFTDRASAVATIRARFTANVVRRDTPRRLQQEAAREERSENKDRQLPFPVNPGSVGSSTTWRLYTNIETLPNCTRSSCHAGPWPLHQ